MKSILNSKYMKWIPIFFFVIYFIFSLSTLTQFPFVHSDEPWLGGLSRIQMHSKSFKVTEPFFDLYPRSPHAIKLLFHVLQMPFIFLGDYSINSLRLMSFIGSVATLYIWYMLLKRNLKNYSMVIAGCFLLCLNIQFFYASHFARQEIWLLIYELLALLWLSEDTIRHPYVKAVILSTAIFIHPNAVLIFAFVAISMILRWFKTDQRSFRNLLIFGSFSIFTILLVIFISFGLNPHFIRDYAEFGSTLGVSQIPLSKVVQFKDFVFKLFYQLSATYYMPNIKTELLFTFILCVITFIHWIQKKVDRQKSSAFLMIMCYLLITIVIGRYNPTSIIFFIVSGYYLFMLYLDAYKKPVQNWIAVLLILLSTANLFTQVNPWTEDHYSPYIESVNEITHGERTLGNLNTDFAFIPHNLLDFRNLNHLNEHGLSLETYIQKNQIQYIALPSEMDYIARNSDRWNIIYGDVSAYYPELVQFIEEDCELAGKIQNNYYSIRILRYIGTPEWETLIYRVK